MGAATMKTFLPCLSKRIIVLETSSNPESLYLQSTNSSNPFFRVSALKNTCLNCRPCARRGSNPPTPHPSLLSPKIRNNTTKNFSHLDCWDCFEPLGTLLTPVIIKIVDLITFEVPLTLKIVRLHLNSCRSSSFISPGLFFKSGILRNFRVFSNTPSTNGDLAGDNFQSLCENVGFAVILTGRKFSRQRVSSLSKGSCHQLEHVFLGDSINFVISRKTDL